MPGYTLDADSIHTLENALLKLGQLEPAIFENVIRRWYNTPVPCWQFVKVTDGTLDSKGRYDAVVQYYYPERDEWVADESTCKLKAANGETLTYGIRYEARATEYENGTSGKVVWVTMCCPDAGSVDVTANYVFVGIVAFVNLYIEAYLAIPLIAPGILAISGRTYIFQTDSCHLSYKCGTDDQTYTIERKESKNQVNGYAGVDSSGNLSSALGGISGDFTVIEDFDEDTCEFTQYTWTFTNGLLTARVLT